MLLGTPVSLYVEIPQQLHNNLQFFLDTNTSWDVDQVMTIALAQFLKSKEKEGIADASLTEELPRSCKKMVSTPISHHRSIPFTELAEPKVGRVRKKDGENHYKSIWSNG